MKLVLMVLGSAVQKEASRRVSDILLFIEVHHLLSNVVISDLESNETSARSTAAQGRFRLISRSTGALLEMRRRVLKERCGLAFVLTCTAFPPIHIFIHSR